MIKGSARRHAGQPIDPLFLDRWSPRAFTGEPLTEAELLSLFEAARWAPSASNLQPWRFLYARRGTDFWPAFLDLLAAGNRSWAERAGALVLFVSQAQLDGGRPSITHAYDTGAAWENFALQASLNGLAAHGMAGFDYERARRVLRIPDGFAILAMAAVGRPGDEAALTDSQRQREQPSDRRPLAQSICEGPFSL